MLHKQEVASRHRTTLGPAFHRLSLMNSNHRAASSHLRSDANKSRGRWERAELHVAFVLSFVCVFVSHTLWRPAYPGRGTILAMRPQRYTSQTAWLFSSILDAGARRRQIHKREFQVTLHFKKEIDARVYVCSRYFIQREWLGQGDV